MEKEYVHDKVYGDKPRYYKHQGYVLPDYITDEILEEVRTFEAREDDIWVMSYPKAGTTWLQEMVYFIFHDLNLEKSMSEQIDYRFPFFEIGYPGIDAVKQMPSPRCIKTHFPFSLLPQDVLDKKPKIFYIARNSKDCAVSYYNFLCKFFKENKTMAPFIYGTVDEFGQVFAKDIVPYAPYWKHVKEAWEKRHDDNVLFLVYEDMKADIHEAIRRIAKFLDKDLSPADVETVAKHCSFDAMKANESCNYTWFHDNGMANKEMHFYRKGQVGDWRNHLSEECAKMHDEIFASKLEPLGIVFKDPAEEVQQ